MSLFVDLPVDEIVMDVITQSRVSMDIEIVEDYAAAMARMDTFPAIVVFVAEGEDEAILADGWYRTMAAKQSGVKSLLAEVIEGDLDDAIMYAAGANETHGIRRTHEDKRKAVKMLLGREKWKDMSSRAIAEAANVDKNTVQKVRESLEVVKSPPGDQGGTVIGKDGKAHPAKKKSKKKAEPVERKALDVLKDISKLYLELPREPKEAIEELLADGGDCLAKERARHIAWWFDQYAKLVAEQEDDEDVLVINAPDPVT